MNSEHNYLIAKIDLAAIESNCRVLREIAGNPKWFCVTVKCNAYGHGLEVVLPPLRKAGVNILAVATIAEAAELIELGWAEPILLFGSEFSIYKGQQKAEMAKWLIENQIRITITNSDDVESLIAAAKTLGKPAVVHAMLDSGMCRMGLSAEALLSLIENIAVRDEITLEGLYTHFANADDSDKSFADAQARMFKEFQQILTDKGLQIPMIHLANSAALLNREQNKDEMVRVGLAAYGYLPSRNMACSVKLIPAMKVVSYLTMVKKIPAGSFVGYGCTWQTGRDTVMGLVPIGYGDGYDRRLSSRAVMTISGRNVPVIGRVSMDQAILDLTDIVSDGVKVEAGQEVVVIDNNPESENSVAAIAEMLDTIPYEIVSGLGPRIIRVPSGV